MNSVQDWKGQNNTISHEHDFLNAYRRPVSRPDLNIQASAGHGSPVNVMICSSMGIILRP
jgi:hypothetical protein